MAKIEKITKKDRYNTIISILDGNMASADVIADLKEFCAKEITALENKAAKAKEKSSSKNSAATDELASAVQAVLTSDFQTIAEIAAQVAGDDVTAPKVTYRLNALVEAGIAEDTVVKSGTGASKRSLKAYRLI